MVANHINGGVVDCEAFLSEEHPDEMIRTCWLRTGQTSHGRTSLALDR